MIDSLRNYLSSRDEPRNLIVSEPADDVKTKVNCRVIFKSIYTRIVIKHLIVERICHLPKRYKSNILTIHILYRIRPNYRTVRLGFSKLLGTLICGKICIYLLRIHYKKDQKTDLFDDDYVIVSDFLYKGICCGHSFELHRQVYAIQMSTHNICF